MRIFICGLILFFSSNLFGQQLDRIYTGIQLSNNDGNHAFIQAESDIGLAFGRLEYLTDFNKDDRVYLKVAFRVVNLDKVKFYIALPPLHYSIQNKGYNTPINFELRIQRLIANFDIYKNNFTISIQIRHQW